MKKPALHSWTWKDHVYGAQVYLLHGRVAEARQWIRENVDPNDDGEFANFVAATMWLETGGKLVMWLADNWRPNMAGDQAMLAHECLHGTFSILASRGIKHSEESEEAYTYLLTWLYQECQTRLQGAIPPRRKSAR